MLSSSHAEIPYGAYWSTPFCKWQGDFAHLHSIEFAAHIAKQELAAREIAPTEFDFGVLGITIPQKGTFWGAPWLMGLIGAGDVAGPTISQACATGIRSLLTAEREVASGMANVALVTGAERLSNGPQLYHPAPDSMGGSGHSENWILDAMFGGDPETGQDMVQTAENVASRFDISTEAQHELVLRRFEQYGDALADDNAFHKRFMTLPFDVPTRNFKKIMGTIDRDQGVYLTDPEKLTKLKPVKEGGTVTMAAQTHPADGNAAIVVTTKDKARELSKDPAISVRILGFGLARAEKAFMPYAPVPAARRALEIADLSIADIDAINTHNPFAVNDIVFAKETGANLMTMNNYGCSLIFGHPHAATTLRQVIALIEELVIRGGGRGLFVGCAAGDSAMAVVIEVTGS